MTPGKDHTANDDGVRRILRILRERFAPDAIDEIYQEVAKLVDAKRTDQTMGAFLKEFDVLREQAEARMAMGSAPPDDFALIICMQDAPLPKRAKSLAPASV